MKNIASGIANGIMLLMVLDVLILFTGLAQIVYEGRSGYWNPFWSWQAQQVVRLMR